MGHEEVEPIDDLTEKGTEKILMEPRGVMANQIRHGYRSKSCWTSRLIEPLAFLLGFARV